MDPLTQLRGESPGIVAVRDQLRRLLQHQGQARRLPGVLILGETGTGKGLLARILHGASARASAPFVDVNCAAIPETLLEAEMFGVERGAFTDARQSKPGLFQLAHRGAIFLDEIGLLSEALQSKLLKVIEEHEVRRLGGRRSEPVDVWVMAATNEDLEDAVRSRRFRADLYHRLAVVTVSLPPLRARGADILLLAEHFLSRACADYGIPPKTLTADAVEALRRYPWPGNVRELSNVLERVALLSEDPVVTRQVLALPEGGRSQAEPESRRPVTLEAVVGEAERQHLLAALQATDWNVSRAAAQLGISRNTLRYRMEKHSLRSGAPASPARQVAASPAPAAEAPSEPVALAPDPGLSVRRRVTLLRAVLSAPDDETSTMSRGTLEPLADKARIFGGRVEEVSATAFVAVFGLEPVEDAPVRAAHAAIALLNGVERLRRDEARELHVKVAIHVGELLVRGPALDPAERASAEAVLDSLLERGAPSEIVVSPSAAPFLERRFDLSLAADGQSFRLRGRGRPGLELRRRRTAFVGRQHELELLRNRFQSALSGRGQMVGIAGDAGIGKSRLLNEFRRAVLGQDADYLRGQCLSYGSATPFLPVLDMVRIACGIAHTDVPETAAGKVRAMLDDLGMDLAHHAPYLLHLLGLKDRELVGDPSPEAVKARIFETLRELTLRRSQRRPLVLGLEDLHWIDETSQELFASMVEAIPGARIMVIATYRTGYRPPWIDKSYVTQVALQPLPPSESLRFVRALFGAEAVSDETMQAILAKAEGNPFFLEELTRSVREQPGPSATLAVPDTVQEVLRTRIDRLPPTERRLLQTAAVVGKDVPLFLLEAVAELTPEVLRHALASLRGAEFLYERSVGPRVEYTFKHALTHDVAYGSLAPEDRRALHGRIVAAIERLRPDRLAEHIEDLGHHAFEGQLWDKALDYLRRAGAKAAGRSAHREAVACFTQALEALRQLPEEPAFREIEIDLRFDLRTSLTPLGEHDRVFGHLREAELVADRLGDRRRLGRVLAYLAEYCRLVGDRERATESGERALALAESLDDLTLKIAVHIYLAQNCHDQGKYREAAAYACKNVEALTGAVVHETFGLPYVPAVHSRTWLVLSLAELGDFPLAIVRGEEALRIAESVDQPFSRTSAAAGLGWLYLRKGEVARATPLLEQALAMSRNWNIRLLFPQIAATLGSVYLLGEQPDRAVPLLEQAVERHAAMRGTAGQSLRLSALADAYLAVQRVEDATRLAERALELGRRWSERGNEAYALTTLGDIAASGPASGLEAGRRFYVEALTLTEALGMRPLRARCQLGLAVLGRRAGDSASAREALARATDLFQTLDMPLGLARVEAEARRLA